MSSIYKRVSGIRPAPLRDLHLQASDPPESATKKQLNLFDRVVDRRSSQLDILPKASLETVYDLLSENKPENPTAAEIRSLLKQLPDKEPTCEKEYKSIIKFLLTENFHKSIDTREPEKGRTKSLEKVKHIFTCLDLAYADYAEEQKQQREREETKKKEKLRALYKDSVDKDKSHTANTAALKEKSTVTKPASSTHAKTTTAATLDTQKKAPHAQTEKEKTTHPDPTGKKAKQETINSSDMGGALSRRVVETIELLSDSDEEMEPTNKQDEQPEQTSEEKKGDGNELESSRNETTLASALGSALAVSNAKKIADILAKNKAKEEAEKEQLELHLFSVETKKRNSAMAFKCGRHPRSAQPIALLPQSAYGNGTAVFRGQADVKSGASTYSSSLREQRGLRDIHIYTHHADKRNSMFIGGNALDDIHERYAKWDPYWKCVSDFSILGVPPHEVGLKTATIIGASPSYPDLPQRGLALHVSLPFDLRRQLNCGQQFGKAFKEKRLILRALPLVVEEKYKKIKSDTHLFPKGTFVQVNNIPMMILQRKQQSHDESLWKGMCHHLDLTHMLNSRQGEFPLKVEVCVKDKAPYNFQLAVCEYTPPENLFQRCIGDGEGAIMKLSYEEGRALVQQNLDQKDAVVLDDSDGDDNDTTIEKSNIYSLLCGVSMSSIQTPVRGKSCKHIQCFDLRNFLLSNITVSGGRWRCVICEDFVPVQDLMIDGFIAKILEEHGKDVSTSRDKVEIHRDGTYKLLKENRLRFQQKRPCSGELPDSKRAKSENQSTEAEVIDILDDDDD
jgi:hypothetical protein